MTKNIMSELKFRVVENDIESDGYMILARVEGYPETLYTDIIFFTEKEAWDFIEDNIKKGE